MSRPKNISQLEKLNRQLYNAIAYAQKAESENNYQLANTEWYAASRIAEGIAATCREIERDLMYLWTNQVHENKLELNEPYQAINRLARHKEEDK